MRRKKYRETKATLLTAVEKTIKLLDGRILSKNADKGLVDCELPGSFLSYGHQVRISVKLTTDKMNTISVSSKSIGIQVIDWGTNNEKEETFIKKINSLIH